MKPPTVMVLVWAMAAVLLWSGLLAALAIAIVVDFLEKRIRATPAWFGVLLLLGLFGRFTVLGQLLVWGPLMFPWYLAGHALGFELRR